MSLGLQVSGFGVMLAATADDDNAARFSPLNPGFYKILSRRNHLFQGVFYLGLKTLADLSLEFFLT